MAAKESDTMKIYKEVFSPIQVNTYIVEGDEGGCIIIRLRMLRTGRGEEAGGLSQDTVIEPSAPPQHSLSS